MNSDFALDAKGWRINFKEGVAIGPTIHFRGYEITLLAEKRIMQGIAGESINTNITFDIVGRGVGVADLEELRDLVMMLLEGVDRPNWE